MIMEAKEYNHDNAIYPKVHVVDDLKLNRKVQEETSPPIEPVLRR